MQPGGSITRLALLVCSGVTQIMYELSVRFIGGGILPLGEFDEHLAALDAAKKFVEFHAADHKVHGSGRTFESFMKDADTIVVIENSTNKYHPQGMHMVLQIKEKSIPYNMAISAGIVEHKKKED